MKFLMKYATRSRPAMFFKTIELYNGLASGNNELQWIISADEDDSTMNNDHVRKFCADRGIPIYYGHSKTKIEAINADSDKPEVTGPWDIGLIIADDNTVLVKGWDERIVAHMPKHLDCGLWFGDGRQVVLNTLSVFGRKIYDRLGYFYNPKYVSVYADNDYQLELELQGRLKYVTEKLFCHEWRTENNDALMKRNEQPAWYKQDGETFKKREAELRPAPISNVATI